MDVRDERVVVLGRKVQSARHISLPRTDTWASRIHALIVRDSTGVTVVDLGCAAGIIMLSRSSDAVDLVSSHPGSRRSIRVEQSETVVLQLGATLVCLNPQVCVICMERPRNVIFDCRHHCCCRKCAGAKELKNCPICRAEISKSALAETEFFTSTMAKPSVHQQGNISQPGGRNSPI